MPDDKRCGTCGWWRASVTAYLNRWTNTTSERKARTPMNRTQLDSLPAASRREALRQIAEQDRRESVMGAAKDGVKANSKRKRLNAPPGDQRPHKYHAQPTEVDGIKFPSKAEAAQYEKLKLLHQAGDVAWFCRQPRFVLPGGVEYVADFIVCYVVLTVSDDYGKPVMQDLHIEIQDVKGFKTPEYRLKKKQVEAIYGVKIVELEARP